VNLQCRFPWSRAVRRLQIMNHHTELVGKIAHEVYRSLGSGFSEDVYDRAMQVGLRLAGIEYESQKVVELKYRDHYVGEGYPDLLVHLGKQKVVVELKAVSSNLGECEEKQLRNYMKILGIEHGLLINFQTPGRKQGKTRLEIRKIAS
jgi:GxxExxY protein